MRAAVLRESNEPIQVEEIGLLELDPDRVLVQTKASPFCSTDVTNFHGNLGKVPPTILGHASAGEVIEVGSRLQGSARANESSCPERPNVGSAITVPLAVPISAQSSLTSAESTRMSPGPPKGSSSPRLETWAAMPRS